MTLDEIKLGETTANYEPALDYIVAKMPRFPFDKFATAANTLSTQMKATGEDYGYRTYTGGMSAEIHSFLGNRRLPSVYARNSIPCPTRIC